MKALSTATVRQLKLKDAVAAEAISQRNLLPPEPGWDDLRDEATDLVDYCTNRLKAGYHAAPEVELAARKPGHGVRPLPYWGVLERIIYRALTEALLKGHPPLDRTPEAYLRFVRAPVLYANDLQKQQHPHADKVFFFFLDSPVKYIVKSDVTAFYQFIDHAVLAEELLLLGAEFELIEALLDLLSEVQGRGYGLPQLLDPSDALSEVYIDRVERDLLRAGLAVWRFNDDFRIACLNYADALAAIESLDRAARATGLVISESKTVTVGFTKYMLDALGKERSEVGETISPDEVEDVVGDYTDDFGEDDSDAAIFVLQAAQADGTGDGIQLRNIVSDDVRMLRRALNGLAKAEDPRGIPEVLRLAIYVPSLTPSVMRYLVKVASSQPETVAGVLDQLMENVSQNEWQQLWLVDVMRTLGLLGGQGGASADRRAVWVSKLRASTKNAPLRAVTTRALAAAARLEVHEVTADADQAPAAMLTFYATAAREARDVLDAEGRAEADRQLDALARSSVLHRVLLASI